jgi:hypothetical protein
MLYFASCSAACCEGDWRERSIVLKDVPASEPMRPFCANAASVPVVSSSETPICEATRPDWFSAMPRSSTEPSALSEPAARRSATCEIDGPCFENWVSAVTPICVAFPTSSCPAAASARAPLRSPPRI